MDQIDSYLIASYSKHKIVKVQAQIYQDMECAIVSIDRNNFDFVEFYEIEFHGKNDKENELWEAQFDAQGILLNLWEIVLKFHDNLSY